LSQIEIYQTSDKVTRVEVSLMGRRVAYTKTTELPKRSRVTITEHITICLKRRNWTKTQYVGISDMLLGMVVLALLAPQSDPADKDLK
jgi:hypothetical protein